MTFVPAPEAFPYFEDRRLVRSTLALRRHTQRNRGGVMVWAEVNARREW